MVEMEASRILLVVAVVMACLVSHSSAGIRKRDTEEDVKDTFNDAVSSVNNAINNVVGTNNCVMDDQCNAVMQYCDSSNVLNPHCAFHGWFLAAVIGAAVLALLTFCVSCFCCPCCCLYSMCKK